ncbi:hypothetical protein GGTG_08298 [Gaeumannomyces tritici R3-111a-1]|uniref:Uncharacterized protein n=1 Tax=Gaeumannomyces tritici (strain R3-111a-1) TaxID=644352 RepID=J3P462_GAET3|nr:hypothetical protein GGTG_08298 [Gaeumannomyces tritici R3-111a-1]EJT74458.1 hypothetical protein GGTG_08298 [Gaeumannomyces tritici R3-111a-1]
MEAGGARLPNSVPQPSRHAAGRVHGILCVRYPPIFAREVASARFSCMADTLPLVSMRYCRGINGRGGGRLSD